MSRQSCAIPRCVARTKSGQIMCRDHWLLVPVTMRRRVTESWRLVCANRDPMHLPDDMARWRSAVTEASEAVMAMYSEAGS